MMTDYIAKKTKPVSRGSVKDILDLSQPIVAMAKEFPSDHTIASHQHTRAQLLYASSGVMTVETESGIWVVPPLRAVWIPAYVHHKIHASGQLSMRTLYIDPAFFPDSPQDCCVIAVSALLRELILHAVAMPLIFPAKGPEERLLLVLLDQIRSVSIAPLELPIPDDTRLRKIYQSLSVDPGDNRTLEGWGKMVGATGRTLARRFRLETGMSFGQWRQQVRILEALRRLSLKEPVTTVAIELGYDSPSAFISMFKKALGRTPGQYFTE